MLVSWLAWAGEELPPHPLHDLAGVGVRQMTIPFRHIHALMAEHFGNLQQRRAGHREIRGARVPQVVKMEVGNAGLSYGGEPGTFNVPGRAPSRPGEDPRHSIF